jgi:hypothetical protein
MHFVFFSARVASLLSNDPRIDPEEFVVKMLRDVVATGRSHTRYARRLYPVHGSCFASLEAIEDLSRYHGAVHGSAAHALGTASFSLCCSSGTLWD